MLYAGVDYHKRYSQVHVIEQGGRIRTTARLANDEATVRKFFESLEEPCAAVLEAGWNWGVMYDWHWLEAIDTVRRCSSATVLASKNRSGEKKKSAWQPLISP